jgi:hypothetical protein
MPLLLVLPPAPTPPVVAEWPGLLGMSWTGSNGTTFELLSNGSPVRAAPGVRGLTCPEYQLWDSSSPAIAGQNHRGSRVLPRECLLPVWVLSDAGSLAWVGTDRAFAATLHPDLPGVWEVTHPDGIRRRLSCRVVDDGAGPLSLDPTASGWLGYQLTLIADQPYWEGDPIVRQWVNATPVNFFGGVPGGFGPPFVIGTGSTISGATITNPGEVDAYPVWTIAGPWTTVTVGTAGRTATLTANVPAGQSRIIDTRPDRLTVVDQAGADRISELSATSDLLAPIPAGREVPLSLSMTGTGAVTASMTPLYRRAW